jgi:hypothetical protein
MFGNHRPHYFAAHSAGGTDDGHLNQIHRRVLPFEAQSGLIFHANGQALGVHPGGGDALAGLGNELA